MTFVGNQAKPIQTKETQPKNFHGHLWKETWLIEVADKGPSEKPLDLKTGTSTVGQWTDHSYSSLARRLKEQTA